ncbi:MAG: hypothetical protein COV37_06045, partial [Bdellovibrio sp. CG11_big_fil_rev_8_21_14_0_20_39_38]
MERKLKLLIITLFLVSSSSFSFAKDKDKEDSDKSHQEKEDRKDDHHNQRNKHLVPPQAHLRVDSKPCQSPCTATLDASKSRAHKGATIVKYVFDYDDGSPLFESSNPIVTYEYSFIKETLSKKHKHKKNIKEFHPKVFVIDSNNKKSKPDREKVRIIAQTDTVPVNQAPVAKLVLNPISGIAPLQVTLDASGSSDDKGIVLYTFIVGNGEIISTTEPILNVVYSSVNVFSPQVVVKDQEGLESSISASVSVSAPPVNQAPIASLSATPILGDAPLLVTFDSSASSDDKEIVNRIYLFGDGQSLTTTDAVVSHLYQQSGNFSASVEVFDQENLSSSKSVSIEVNTPNTAPIASLLVDQVRANPGSSFKFDGSTSTDAENNIISFSLSSTTLGINQTNTTGIFDIVISQPGNFDFIFTVADSFGLSDSKTMSISVNAPPIALLSADKISGEAPLTVTFDSSASSDDVSIIKRDYQFAPNVFALNAGSTVSYTYNEPGVFPAKIQIYDGENLVSEAMVEITVTAPEIKTPPIAWFQIEADSSTGLVRLKNQAIAGSSNITSVSYLVNNQVSLSSAIYAYSEASFQAEGGLRYDIKQIVTDEQNQTSEETISVIMDETQQAPVPQFTIAQSNINQVFLNALYSFDLLNSTTSMKINWGDQTPEETLSSHFASHNYQNAGVYSVTLTLENAQNLTSSLTREITVTNSTPEALNPVANFMVLQDETIKHVRLLSQYSASPNGEILSYFWQYGDGQVGYGEESIHFYEAGLYLARLTITDSMGVRASQVQQILITNSGPAIISKIDQCNAFGLYGECDFFVANKDKELDRVEINWGDGNIDSYPVANNEWQIFDAIGHNYQSAGTYDVTVSAITFSGMQATASSQITTEGNGTGNIPPVANIYCSSNFLQVTCDSSFSYDPDGLIVSTEIQMGDGTSYFDNFVNHSYQQGGTYIVRAIVTDQLGASTQTEILVNAIEKINRAPIVFLSCSSNSINTVQCQAVGSFDSDGSIVKIEYQFDDETTIVAIDENDIVSKVFSSGGLHQIVLVATDNEGATASASQNVEVIQNQLPVANFECQTTKPLEISCANSGSLDYDGEITSLNWQIDGASLYTGNEFTHKFSSGTSIANISLIVTDNFNDQGISTNSYSIIPPPAPALSISCFESANLRLSCSPQFVDDFGLAQTYSWIVNGIIYSTENIEIQFESSIEAIISLEVTSSTGLASNSSSNFSLIDQGTGVGKSLAEVVLTGIDESTFNPLLNEFEFLIANSEVLIAQNGLPDFFSLIVNDLTIPVETVLIEQGRVLAPVVLEEGTNYVTLSFKDFEGREFRKEWEFISGSGRVDVNLTDNSGSPISLTKIHAIHTNFSNRTFSFNSTPILNIPKGRIIFISDENNFIGVNSVEATDTPTVLDIVSSPLNSLVAHSDYEFENGFDNWQMIRGLGETLLHENSTSFVQYPDSAMDANFSPDLSGISLVATRFSFNQDVFNVAYPMNIISSSPDSFLLGIIKNPNTGEISFNMNQVGGDYTTGNLVETPANILIESPDHSDRIFVVYSQFFGTDFVTVKNQSVNPVDYFISRAFAAGSGSGTTAKPPIRNSLGQAKIFNRGTKTELVGISLGTYPSLYPGVGKIYESTTIQGQFQNPLTIKINGMTQELYNSYKYELALLSTSNQLLAILPLEKRLFGNDFDVKIPSGWYNPDQDFYRLSIRVISPDFTIPIEEIFLESRYIKDEIPVITKYEFPTIIAMGDQLLNPTTVASIKYVTDINAGIGYDNWAAYKYRLNIYSLINSGNVKFGDFGGINGSQLLASGTRKGHIFGTDIDIEVNGTAAAIPISPAPPEKSESSAILVKRIIDQFPNQLRAYLLFSEENSPFFNFVDSSCSKDGRFLRNVAINDQSHKDHHHISFWGGRNEKTKPDFNPDNYLNNSSFIVTHDGYVKPKIEMMPAVPADVLSDQSPRKLYQAYQVVGMQLSDKLYYHKIDLSIPNDEYKWTLVSRTEGDDLYYSGDNVFINRGVKWDKDKVVFKLIRMNGNLCFESDQFSSGYIFPRNEPTFYYTLNRFVALDSGYYYEGSNLSVNAFDLDRLNIPGLYTENYTGPFDVGTFNSEYQMYGLKSPDLKLSIRLQSENQGLNTEVDLNDQNAILQALNSLFIFDENNIETPIQTSIKAYYESSPNEIIGGNAFLGTIKYESCKESDKRVWNPDSAKCINCDLNDPKSHYLKADDRCITCDEVNLFWYEPLKGCFSCDLNNPNNHWVNSSCVTCSTGQIWYEQGQHCVTCPTGTLRGDGTCDWPTPVLTVTPTSTLTPDSSQCSEGGTHVITPSAKVCN